jgi:hypothetical protein
MPDLGAKSRAMPSEKRSVSRRFSVNIAKTFGLSMELRGEIVRQILRFARISAAYEPRILGWGSQGRAPAEKNGRGGSQDNWAGRGGRVRGRGVV